MEAQAPCISSRFHFWEGKDFFSRRFQDFPSMWSRLRSEYAFRTTLHNHEVRVELDDPVRCSSVGLIDESHSFKEIDRTPPLVLV